MRKYRLAPIILSQDILSSVEPYNVKCGWDSKDAPVEKFKEIIKGELNRNQSGRCAYCDLSLETRNPEIDHIAPKGGSKRPKHVEFTFLPLNLVYACHNCNSTTCKGSIDVVTNKHDEYVDWEFSIVHPYLDDPIDFFHVNKNDEICILPKRDADEYHKKKAKETINIFNLNSEGKLNEIAKQIEFEHYPDTIRRIIKEISCYSPDL